MKLNFLIVIIFFFLITTTTLTISSNLSRNIGYQSLNVNDIPKETDWVNNLPKETDWAGAGVITRVKNQYECGCGWAFATVAAVEAVNRIVTGTLMELSEQQLVDCIPPLKHRRHNCNGNYVPVAYDYIMKHGIVEEQFYPYQNTDIQICPTEAIRIPAAIITGYEFIIPATELNLMRAVANHPVVAVVDVDENFRNYDGMSIFEDVNNTCVSSSTKNSTTRHAVAIVGHGVENGVEFWKIKNSWGDKGYMRMRRNDPTKPYGVCNIARRVTYPTNDSG